MTSERKDEGRTGSMKGSAEEYLFTKPYSIQIIKVLHVPVGLHYWGTNQVKNWRKGEKRWIQRNVCMQSAKAAALGDSFFKWSEFWVKVKNVNIGLYSCVVLRRVCFCVYVFTGMLGQCFDSVGKWSETPQANSSVHLPFIQTHWKTHSKQKNGPG